MLAQKDPTGRQVSIRSLREEENPPPHIKNTRRKGPEGLKFETQKHQTNQTDNPSPSCKLTLPLLKSYWSLTLKI